MQRFNAAVKQQIRRRSLLFWSEIMAEKGSGVMQTMKMNVEALSTMASQGMTRKQCADFYGITPQRFNQILGKEPDLLAAFDSGLAQGIQVATKALMDRVKNGDLIAILFFLKCRAGFVEEQYLLKNREDKNDLPRVQIFLPDNSRDIALNTQAVESIEHEEA